LFKSYGLKTTN